MLLLKISYFITALGHIWEGGGCFFRTLGKGIYFSLNCMMIKCSSNTRGQNVDGKKCKLSALSDVTLAAIY